MIEVNYNEYKETIADNMKLIQENHQLKERIDKAIEYIKALDYENEETYDIGEYVRNELLEILGSDKE